MLDKNALAAKVESAVQGCKVKDIIELNKKNGIHLYYIGNRNRDGKYYGILTEGKNMENYFLLTSVSEAEKEYLDSLWSRLSCDRKYGRTDTLSKLIAKKPYIIYALPAHILKYLYDLQQHIFAELDKERNKEVNGINAKYNEKKKEFEDFIASTTKSELNV